MNRVTAAVWVFFALFLSAATIASAQTTTGTILGEVKDSTGGRLPGVSVNLLNQANGATRETVTDELGTYRFTALPPGTYTITVELAGFATSKRADVVLPIASQIAAPFTLEVAGLAESVMVTQQAPLIDTTEQTVRTNVETKQIASLPLKSRDFLDLTLLAPGVVSDQSSASGGNTGRPEGLRYGSCYVRSFSHNGRPPHRRPG